ncbi:MAG: hypothetical protein MZV64_26730 [Ignavibacteriales bacterium]|nr:hypothetical protein [Ignavibacteriales bacterium]
MHAEIKNNTAIARWTNLSPKMFIKGSPRTKPNINEAIIVVVEKRISGKKLIFFTNIGIELASAGAKN